MKSLKLCLLPLWCLAAFSQDAVPSENAPPEVDKALRARVTQFYSANVSGKWRDAFQVVADDMQNEYLAASKEPYDRCDTIKISYTDNFAKATVRENCHGEYTWHNSHLAATIPLTSMWKLVDGQWFWYYLKPTEMMTPWGLSTASPDAPKVPGSSTVDTKIEAVVKDPASVANAILGQIKIDKKEIHLLGYETSRDEVHIINTMPGTVSIRINCALLPGFHVKQGNPDIGPTETSTIAFDYDAEEAKNQCGECYKLPKPRLTAYIRVEPTAQVFAVRITFGIPPEVEKQLPKELRPSAPKQ
jgi:hypothetical protein